MARFHVKPPWCASLVVFRVGRCVVAVVVLDVEHDVEARVVHHAERGGLGVEGRLEQLVDFLPWSLSVVMPPGY